MHVMRAGHVLNRLPIDLLEQSSILPMTNCYCIYCRYALEILVDANYRLQSLSCLLHSNWVTGPRCNLLCMGTSRSSLTVFQTPRPQQPVFFAVDTHVFDNGNESPMIFLRFTDPRAENL